MILSNQWTFPATTGPFSPVVSDKTVPYSHSCTHIAPMRFK